MTYLERRQLCKHRADLFELGFRFSFTPQLQVTTSINVLGSHLKLDRNLLSNITRRGSVSGILHEIFKSKACRYAKKFGDKISAEECG